jgi:tetratricopeptide (TPR) repeat protein
MDIRGVYKLAKEGMYDEAIQICGKYIVAHPNQREGYKQRSYIFGRMKLWEDAIRDVDILINMGHEEPDDYFSRGRWNLMAGHTSSSIEDFSKVIEIEIVLPRKYYTESAYFYRANAYMKMGFFQRAIDDCEKVRDGFKVHLMGKIVSKADILSEARARLNPL